MALRACWADRSIHFFHSALSPRSSPDTESVFTSVPHKLCYRGVTILKRWVLTVIPLAVCATTLTVLQYGPTLQYGLYYDDYHFAHPYSSDEIRRVFHGPWDADGIEVPFYRPLTICFYAARFAAFGLNSYAYHALSLVLFAAAAVVFGVLAAQLLGRLSAGVLACGVFVIHPAMPYSAVAWTTNQMHLIELLAVLVGALWWFAIRRRHAGWWMPLVLLQVIVLMIKEDGVMLIPSIVVLHTMRKYIVEKDLPHVSIRFLAAAAVGMGSLLWFRFSVLHGIGGYHLPPADRAWSNLTRGFVGVFRLVPAKRPYQPAASWFVTLVPLASVLMWKRITPLTRFGIVAALSLGILFNLPFIFVVKVEQLHLVATGASLLLATACIGILESIPLTLPRVPALFMVGMGLAAMSAVTRNITHDFEPFGPIVLRNDLIVQGWTAVPSELREYLARKALPGAKDRVPANPARALESVAFGVHGSERNGDGVRLRWMSSTTTDFLIRSEARSVTIPIRHEIGAFREPARATVLADGRVLDVINLDDGRWRHATVALRQGATVRFSGMHHVQIKIDHVWIPAIVIPGSTDRRVLGLQVGDIEVR